MRLAFAAATFVALALSWLLQPGARAEALDLDVSRHEMKMTYCIEQKNKRFYRTEKLDDLCVLKVAFFDDQVGWQTSSIKSVSLMQVVVCTLNNYALNKTLVLPNHVA